MPLGLLLSSLILLLIYIMADFHVVGYMGYFLVLRKLLQAQEFHGNDRFWYHFTTMVLK